MEEVLHYYSIFAWLTSGMNWAMNAEILHQFRAILKCPFLFSKIWRSLCSDTNKYKVQIFSDFKMMGKFAIKDAFIFKNVLVPSLVGRPILVRWDLNSSRLVSFQLSCTLEIESCLWRISLYLFWGWTFWLSFKYLRFSDYIFQRIPRSTLPGFYDFRKI